MPVQDLRQAHLDHLTNKERHVVDALCDDDQFTLPKERRGLLTQLHSHGVLSSIKIEPIRLEDNNGTSLAKMLFHPALRVPPKN